VVSLSRFGAPRRDYKAPALSHGSRSPGRAAHQREVGVRSAGRRRCRARLKTARRSEMPASLIASAMRFSSMGALVSPLLVLARNLKTHTYSTQKTKEKAHRELLSFWSKQQARLQLASL
jgi:hypothetical protein